MSDYKTIHGFTVKSYTTDPDNLIQGQVWYDKTNEVLQLQAAGAGAWSTGNNINTGRDMAGGAGIQTAAIIAGGGTSPHQNAIEYLTIATLGNTSDFGDLNQGNASGAGTSSPTRGVISGMKTPSVFNTIEYITIATLGNAKDFGDLTAEKSVFGACSNAHGGL